MKKQGLTPVPLGFSLAAPLPAVSVAAQKLALDAALVDFLQRPTRELSVTIPIELDDGQFRAFQGFRVQYAFATGPCKGGVRYLPDATLEETRLLAFYMNLKSALLGLPFGGGKGAVVCDPTRLSVRELARLTKAYTVAIADIIGPDKDVLGPDINTSEQTMAWMFDAYSLRVGYAAPAVVTGKPLFLGGTQGRREATGRGVGMLTLRALLRHRRSSKGVRVAVQGFGNVGSVAAEFLQENGLLVVGISDMQTALVNPQGIDVQKAQKHVAKHRTLKGFDGGDQLTSKPTESQEAILQMDCDVLIPAASENQLTGKNAPHVKANLIVEGANGPTTPEADTYFKAHGITVVPDLVANAGGVTLSHFEWLQNRAGVAWSDATIFQNLEVVLLHALEAMDAVAAEFDVTLREAAHIIALKRMADIARTRLA